MGNDFFMDHFTIFEMIGTIAFAISGALKAVKNKMDLFGVISLGIITATAGGVMRDIIAGSFPPSAFVHPVYVLTAGITSLVVFLYAYFRYTRKAHLSFSRYAFMLSLGDAIGLGIFTTMGMHTVIELHGMDNGFLCVFSGMVTGIGGGVLRDMMLHEQPEVFRKYVYALASIIGGIVSYVLFLYGESNIAIYGGSVLIICIRLLAAHYRWSLPKITTANKAEEGD